MSAGDWVRMKRLSKVTEYGKPGGNKAIDLAEDTDMVNVVLHSDPFNPETLISRVVGAGRTRREASKWTDFVAAVNTDYLTHRDNKSNDDSSYQPVIVRNKLCPCETTILTTRVGPLRSNIYQHKRIN